MKNISILGVTGSIGSQTIDVVRKSRDEFNIIGISADKSSEKTIEIIKEFNPKYVAMMNKEASNIVREFCIDKKLNIEVYSGIEGLNKIACAAESDIVVTSVVGMVGLVPTLKAIEEGKDIALANKETLVAAGHLVMDAAEKKGVRILPVDSEHNAIFQCLLGNKQNQVSKLLLTASGGPFRGLSREELRGKTAEDAVKHPKWNMGRKISVDSSTLMNKGLEVIEAHWLFNIDYDKIQVVVHPQSVIHSMVEYNDGSIIAELSSTDMRLPIQYALNYPERKKGVVKKLDFYSLGNLTFEKPDINTFRCLKLAYEAGKEGGNKTAVLNSSNEEAVELFLNNKIKYLEIEDIVEDCLNKFEYVNNPSLEEILECDKKVRNYIKGKYI